VKTVQSTKLPSRRYSDVRFVESTSIVPEDPGATIFVVGTKEFPKWILFRCPCEQIHRLMIPLMETASPHWTVKFEEEKVDLWPSVAVDGDPCYSHFWLRHSQVYAARWSLQKRRQRK
jgi:hypothetical protein